MKCIDCPHYTGGYMFNRCGVTGDEYYKTVDNCTLVNEDGSLNYDRVQILGGARRCQQMSKMRL